ncbi:hypothetical protein [Methanogenium organophilum]|uniref:Uncharacterized protein n=1 Tax=Methanogenium organophilum TaxID=2199 RepID=A0A9X9S6C1_METOG|nr:hypothetical protein [Methanogenium organophilum]WAI02491.1 hypothetical protein OU421_06345 [Methanogenium organophilum]
MMAGPKPKQGRRGWGRQKKTCRKVRPALRQKDFADGTNTGGSAQAVACR